MAVGLVGPPHGLSGDAELRGSGGLALKSVELWLVSVQPPLARKAAVAVDSVTVGEPSAQFAVKP